MAKYINEFTELRHYRDLAVRADELYMVTAHINMDQSADWCDEDLEVVRHAAYMAVKKYCNAIDERKYAMTNEMYRKLDFADTFKPRRSFWDIFKRKES